ncbi:uncharacterized protein K452DRAFT_95469 [Aplosporella prunicola CBS 121167]|uniref:Uncharacterized protein n=1 Tax=Aplosporella prunicola CBS 121167 TaxID=1176127 RepID=A0A6A6B1N1_9PEZI|nr:uncharacterized protein K452DRAFT_95469 [Aplosporella prunicola CBS 121167]KAF2138122.1 hypothetical protein K452DRAFT_95469 [Aplosporella prunicola CBS 121167]
MRWMDKRAASSEQQAGKQASVSVSEPKPVARGAAEPWSSHPWHEGTNANTNARTHSHTDRTHVSAHRRTEREGQAKGKQRAKGREAERSIGHLAERLRAGCPLPSTSIHHDTTQTPVHGSRSSSTHAGTRPRPHCSSARTPAIVRSFIRSFVRFRSFRALARAHRSSHVCALSRLSRSKTSRSEGRGPCVSGRRA